MITIVEGTDGVGKTTYATSLAEQTGRMYLHAGAPTKRTWVEEYVEPLMVTGRTALVLDRWHLGEVIWPKLFDRPSLFHSNSDFYLCNRMLKNAAEHHGGIEIVILVRDPKDIATTLRERGESEDDIKVSLAAQDLYGLAARMVSHIPVTIVNSNSLVSA